VNGHDIPSAEPVIVARIRAEKRSAKM